MAIDYYRPNVSGLTLYAEHLAEGLAQRGHDVRVLTHRHLPELPEESDENGVRVLRAPVAARVGKALVSPAILARALRELPRADVLHLHAPLVNAVPLAFLASTLRVPILVTFHCDLQPPPRLGQRFVEVLARASHSFALERADRVITYTEDYARHTRPLRDRIEKVGWVLPPVADPPETGRSVDDGPRPLRPRERRPGPTLSGPVRGGEGPARSDAGVRARSDGGFPGRSWSLPVRRRFRARRFWRRSSPARRSVLRGRSRRGSCRRPRSPTCSRCRTCSCCLRSTRPSPSVSSRSRPCSAACPSSPRTCRACASRSA